ncbi:MAG: 50S ribosomal protein L13 [Candidatus Paceibacterota bacterium]
MTKNFTLDASGKKIGRLASEVAAILLGKSNADFQKHLVADVKVEVVNASKMDITEKKARTKTYRNYSGYPGGLHERTLEEVAVKKGYAEVLEKAVSGMIHNTRMKKEILKNLIVKE